MQSLQHTDCHSISQQHPERAQKPEHKEQEGDQKKKKKTYLKKQNKTGSIYSFNSNSLVAHYKNNNVTCLDWATMNF